MPLLHITIIFFSFQVFCRIFRRSINRKIFPSICEERLPKRKTREDAEIAKKKFNLTWNFVLKFQYLSLGN